MKVLLLADDCNPDWPSLPVVGYKSARALADEVELTVATHVRNRPAIEREGFGRATVVYIDNEYIARPMHRFSTLLRGGTSVGWSTNVAMAYLPYLAFEREVWKTFRHELEAGIFDLVHRLTPMSPTLPSLMAKKSPVPFVVGPLNGGLRWPLEFQYLRRREREWMTYVRRLHQWLPYYRSTYRRSACILTAFKHTKQDVPTCCTERCIDFPEVGVDPGLFHHDSNVEKPGTPMTMLFVGRLVPYKCADIAIQAFSRSAALKRHRLKIIGDGPEEHRLRSLVDHHRLHGCVEFLGSKSQQEVGRIMREEANVFVFPSIRELGAGVVVEAMASGLACVGVDYGAPGTLLGNGRGIAVSLGNREELITRYVRELESLVNAPERIQKLGNEARKFAMDQLTWSAKARKFTEVYRWVTGETPEKPRFWPPGEY